MAITFELVAKDVNSAELFSKLAADSGVALKRVEQNAKGAQDGFDKLGDKIMKAALGGATGFAVMEATIGKASEALREMNALAERGAALRMTGAESMRELAQFAGGDAGKLRGLIGEVEKTRMERGVGVADATAFQVQLQNAGMEGSRSEFAKLYSGKVNAAEMVESVAGIRSAFAGGDSLGTDSDVLNKIMAVTEYVKAPPSAVAKNMQQSAAIAKLIGATDEETMAAVGVASDTLGAAEGGTALNRFLTEASQKGWGGGKGIKSAVDAVTALNLPANELAEALPQGALKGYVSLRDNPAKMAALEYVARAEQQRPMGSRYVDEMAGVSGQVFGTELERANARQRREIAQESSAASASVLRYETGVDTAAVAMGGGIVGQWAGDKLSTMAKPFLSRGGGAAGAMAFGAGAYGAPAALSGGSLANPMGMILPALQLLAERLAHNTRATEQNTGVTPGAPANGGMAAAEN